MHSDQFTATGPSNTGAGFPRAAFSTTGGPDTGEYGVNVKGGKCGIFGCSDTLPTPLPIQRDATLRL